MQALQKVIQKHIYWDTLLFLWSSTRKKNGIQRCSALLNDKEAYEKLKKRVHEAEKSGVSPSLKSSTITKKDKALCSRPLE
jgi:hypothetical protein